MIAMLKEISIQQNPSNERNKGEASNNTSSENSNTFMTVIRTSNSMESILTNR